MILKNILYALLVLTACNTNKDSIEFRLISVEEGPRSLELDLGSEFTYTFLIDNNSQDSIQIPMNGDYLVLTSITELSSDSGFTAYIEDFPSHYMYIGPNKSDTILLTSIFLLREAEFVYKDSLQNKYSVRWLCCKLPEN